MGEKSVEDPDKMIIAHAETKSMLKKFRPYIENADLLIVDLEGDQDLSHNYQFKGAI